jgi:predicted amino acid-binding ACT domain protein
MALKVTKTHVWAAEIEDQPGGLAKVLGPIGEAGANLACVIARRKPDKPGTGVVFVTPLAGKRVLAAAEKAGFHTAGRVVTLKVEGDDRPGLGARLARAIGDAGVSMRGLSAAVIGARFVCYIAFDSESEAAKAAAAIKALGRKGK